MSLEIGQRVPDFSLRDQHGQTVTLSAVRESKVAVVMFYPFAFSRVCTGELHEVRDGLAAFSSQAVEVLAISCDPMFALRAFAERDALTFPLLSDFWPHGAVARAYGVFDETSGCASRSTFIVDREGKLCWQVHNQRPDARDLAEQTRVLSDLVG